MKLCAELHPAFWIMWHHAGPGWWWTLGRARALPASVPVCAHWITHPDLSLSFVPSANV